MSCRARALLVACSLATPAVGLAEVPRGVAAFTSCPASAERPLVLGWCSHGDVRALVHSGGLVYAEADGEVWALAQAAAVARTGKRFRGVLQANLVTFAEGGATALLRVGLFNDVQGEDWTLAAAGLANRARHVALTDRSAGLRLALLANDTSFMDGVQLAFLLNRATALRGLQAGVVVNEAAAVRGLQAHAGAVYGYVTLASRLVRTGRIDSYRDTWALAGLLLGGINRTGELAGVQVAGWLNQVDGSARGLQLGLVNLAGDLTGLQLGLFNRATRLRGLQLGLLNVADNAALRVLPIANAAW